MKLAILCKWPMRRRLRSDPTIDQAIETTNVAVARSTISNRNCFNGIGLDSLYGGRTIVVALVDFHRD
jgi:hypothetical protein